MTPKVYPASTNRERQRCLALVRAYREKIEDSMNRRTPVTAYEDKVAQAVVKSLRNIEFNIECPDGKDKSNGDFSLDEMAIAEQLIAEQEHNPFEG